MPVRELLRRLDERVLPPVARVLSGMSRGARRLRAVTIIASVVSVAAVLVTVYAAQQPRPDPPPVAIVWIGVAAGASIPAYVQRTQAELVTQTATAARTGTTRKMFALVSFRAYLAPDQLTTLLSGVQVANVFLRVPIRDRTTEIVNAPAYSIPVDVTNAMSAIAGRKAQQVADFRRLEMIVGGNTADNRQLDATYRADAEVAHVEELAYRRMCACVYAAVVYATPVTLGTLAAWPQTRSVDAAPGLLALDRAVFAPPLPEQHDRAQPPVDPAE